MSDTPIILASASTARAALLRQAGVVFETRRSNVDEAALTSALSMQGVTPRDLADALAEAKAVKVSSVQPGLVIGADSVLECDGHLYDKAADLAEARKQLTALAGKTHKLHSAVVIAAKGAPLWRTLSTAKLTMRPFSPAFLDAYLEAEGEAVLSCVGGYRLEGLGAQLFSAIEGDYFAILGLPLLPVLDFLRVRGALAS